MNRKVTISIIIGALILLISAGLFLFFTEKTLTDYKVTPTAVADNILYPDTTSGGIRFFTGSGFALLDTTSFSTTSLSRLHNLPIVTFLQWGENTVLFQASGYTGDDELSQILSQQNIDQTKNHWWVWSKSSDSFTLVGGQSATSVTSAVISSDDTVSYLKKDGNQTQLISLKAGQEKTSKSYAATAQLAAPTPQGAIILEDGKLIDSTSTATKPLLTQVTQVVGYDPAGSTLAYYQGDAPSLASQQSDEEHTIGKLLKTINLSSKNTHEVSSNFSGVVYWDGLRKEFITLSFQVSDETTKASIKTRSNTQTTNYTLAKPTEVAPTAKHIVALSDTTFGISSLSSGSLQMVYTGQTKTPANRTKPTGYMSASGYTAIYVASTNTLTVTLKNSKDFGTVSEALKTSLQASKIDPNQLNIIWSISN